MKRFSFVLTCLFMAVYVAWGGGGISAVAQTRSVSGIVTDEAGDPVIGATVAVTGVPSIGIATDLKGAFTLSIPVDAKTLTISYVGMLSQTVAVAPNVHAVFKANRFMLNIYFYEYA